MQQDKRFPGNSIAARAPSCLRVLLLASLAWLPSACGSDSTGWVEGRDASQEAPAPRPGVPFTLVALPDTQYLASSYPEDNGWSVEFVSAGGSAFAKKINFTAYAVCATGTA